MNIARTRKASGGYCDGYPGFTHTNGAHCVFMGINSYRLLDGQAAARTRPRYTPVWQSQDWRHQWAKYAGKDSCRDCLRPGSLEARTANSSGSACTLFQWSRVG